jgi:hypothetical protein
LHSFPQSDWVSCEHTSIKMDMSIDNITSINLEVLCKRKVGLCLNLTHQHRWQCDHFQLIDAHVNTIHFFGDNYLCHTPYSAKN